MSRSAARAHPLTIGLDNEGIKHRTVRGAGATALAQVLKFGLQFGSQIVLARMLGPTQFGLVAMVAPLLGLVITLNDFGFGQAIVQRGEISLRQVSAVFWLNLAIGAAFTLAMMLAAPLIVALYGEPRALGVTLASAPLILLTSLSVVPMALLNRQMRFASLAAVEVGAMLSGLASGIAAAWLGAGYWSLVIMQAVNASVALLLAWWRCGWWPGRPQREPGTGALMRFGTNLMGANVAAYLTTSADNVVVGMASGPVALGLYDRSYNLVVKPLGQLMAPIGRVALPLLSRWLAAPTRYGRAYVLMVQLSIAACVPGLIATIACAGPLITLLLGDKWAPMTPIFVWICVGGIAVPLTASTYWLFITQDRTGEQMRFNMACAAISLASFVLGAPWGPVGVAMVAALSYTLLQTPLVVWAATRRGPVTLAMLRAGLLPLAAAGVLAAVAAAGTARLGLPRSLLVVAVYAASYGTFACALLALPAGRRLVAEARGVLSSARHAPARAAA